MINTTTSPSFLLTAPWILTGRGALAHGAVLVQEGIITKVLAQREWQSLDLTQLTLINEERCLVSPGLINMHTHLDYTAAGFLYESEPDKTPMFSWLRALVSHSRSWSKTDIEDSARLGASLLASAGVSLAVDSSYTGEAARALAGKGLRGIVGLELFGLSSEKSQFLFSLWQKRFEEWQQESILEKAQKDGRLLLTISPHAPYTVSPALWRLALAWAKEKKLPILCHLAESKNESQWLAGGDATIDDYLMYVMPGEEADKKQLLANLDFKKSASPVQHLSSNGLLDPSTLTVAAHCIHIDLPNINDLDILAENQVTLALCPRSNARLGNGHPPLGKIAQAAKKSSLVWASGLQWALGTDSLASSPDLDPRREAAALLAQSASAQLPFSPAEMHSRITDKAACALGLGHRLGELSAGKEADIAVFEVADAPLANSEEEAYRQFFALKDNCFQARLKTLYVRGKIIEQGRIIEDIDNKS